MIIKAGTTLTLTHGEYSDFTYEGPFVVVRDFDQATALDTFRAWWAMEQSESIDEAFSSDVRRKFIGWLHLGGFIEDVPTHVTWYLGAYGFEPREPALEAPTDYLAS